MNSLPDPISLIPAKARIPVERLIARSLIDRATVDSAVDAVVYAGKPDRLLPFITAVLHLKSQGISVTDIVHMARANGRRINLDWTPRRWKEEHQRLSRFDTLKALTQANVAYDLTAFRSALPEWFPGYLIPSSRRLGAEGLRQRHCVATYHSGILTGAYAIAAVFIDRTRFTVQICRSAGGLYIGQARARDNVQPNSDQLEKLHHLLGLTIERSQRDDVASREGPTYLEAMQAVLPVLRQHAVQEVRVTFDGSGDSGTIDHASFKPSIDAGAIHVEIPVIDRQLLDDRWQKVRILKRLSLQEAVDVLAESYIAAQDCDWYNNDGGWGSIFLNVETGHVEITIDRRFTESECVVSETIDIATGEVIE